MYSFSEALRIMDHNTVLYMIDSLKVELAEKNAEIARLQAKIARRSFENKYS